MTEPDSTEPDDDEPRLGPRPQEISGGTYLAGFTALVAAKGLAPFLEAFAKKLGEALGESTTAAFARLRSVKGRNATVVQAELPQHAKVAFVLDPDTPDEARLALLDLDVTAPELRGKILRWNSEANAWLDIEAPEPGTEKA
jgi:hypothetical protein